MTIHKTKFSGTVGDRHVEIVVNRAGSLVEVSMSGGGHPARSYVIRLDGDLMLLKRSEQSSLPDDAAVVSLISAALLSNDPTRELAEVLHDLLDQSDDEFRNHLARLIRRDGKLSDH
jgi:hypothetical protein